MLIPSKPYSREEWLGYLIDLCTSAIASFLIFWNLFISPMIQSTRGEPFMSQALAAALALSDGESRAEALAQIAPALAQAGDVNGVAAAKLELIPKSTRLRNNIARILLWIDPGKGISIQQQLFEPGGDYRLAKYADIQINQKLPDNVFKLKTTAKTRFISPQG